MGKYREDAPLLRSSKININREKMKEMAAITDYEGEIEVYEPRRKLLIYSYKRSYTYKQTKINSVAFRPQANYTD
jgi:hypothetical protein